MSIEPKNVSAQLAYQARGNPPGAHSTSAVGNFFPGLEFNFLSAWKRIFIGIELNESSGHVMAVDPDASEEIRGLLGYLLIAVDVTIKEGEVVPGSGFPVVVDVTGPSASDPTGPHTVLTQVYLEWGNALADLHFRKGGTGEDVTCLFQKEDLSETKWAAMKLRRLFDADTALLSREAVAAGELTQSLCSPWQTDFIGCACYYWAANRPDYINIWQKADGSHGGGHHWLDETRSLQPDPSSGGTPKPFYSLRPEDTLKHEDIIRKHDWEKRLRFIIAGKDEVVE
jgi:hypothetical protein